MIEIPVSCISNEETLLAGIHGITLQVKQKRHPGAVNCSITLKNGSFLMLQFSKLGGLDDDMPHNEQYRKKTLTLLYSLNCEH